MKKPSVTFVNKSFYVSRATMIPARTHDVTGGEFVITSCFDREIGVKCKMSPLAEKEIITVANSIIDLNPKASKLFFYNEITEGVLNSCLQNIYTDCAVVSNGTFVVCDKGDSLFV